MAGQQSVCFNILIRRGVWLQTQLDAFKSSRLCVWFIKPSSSAATTPLLARCVEKAHAIISSSDVRFWDWSLDELARYDFPAMVDYVRKAAGVGKIIYVGHSQGNAQAFLGCKFDSRMNEKISCFVALAPTAYIGPLLK